ncbi:MAG: MBL fold metallo-hydrolase [Bacillota bacterium]
MKPGKVRVIYGKNGGRFPFCNSIFIDDSIKVVVDPGAGPDILEGLKAGGPVDMVINTHYHFDHIVYNHLFSNSKIYINQVEGDCFRSKRELAGRLGMTAVYGEGWVRGWMERISNPGTPQSPFSPQNRHEWWLSASRVDGTYRWGEVFDFGSTRMEVIGAPGHTAGFSCLYFPEQDAVYTGDIDLTHFGPWYGGSDGDIDLFIDSARKIADLRAGTYITGHEAGSVSWDEFKQRLEKFLDIINIRDAKILAALSTGPMNRKELSSLGLIYDRRYLVDDWLRAWEELMVEKHLKRLVGMGEAGFDGDSYYRI